MSKSCSCPSGECHDVGAPGCGFGSIPRPPNQVVDGTPVVLRRGMVGTYEGQPAILRIAHPGGAARPGLVWLECEVVWSHGSADGFWAGPAEYEVL